MRAAVDDVHQRHRQDVRVRAADPAVERHTRRRPLRPSPPRATRRGWRWRRAAPSSACRRARSGGRRRARWSVASSPSSASAISPLTCATARPTPFPSHASPPSRSSTASCSPVDAPDGTAAIPNAPESRPTSTSTVGFPRESSTCRPWTWTIALIGRYAGAFARRRTSARYRRQRGARCRRRRFDVADTECPGVDVWSTRGASAASVARAVQPSQLRLRPLVPALLTVEVELRPRLPRLGCQPFGELDPLAEPARRRRAGPARGRRSRTARGSRP